MDTIYQDGAYLRNNPTWHEDDSPWKASQILRMLDRNQLKPLSIAEIGCGAGEIVSQLSQRLGAGTRLFGYEISPQAFDLCLQRDNSKTNPHLRYRLGNLLDEETVFDLVMAIDVFEHIENYFDFLRRLKPRGVHKLFHIPLDLSVQSVLRGTSLLKLRGSVGHLHYFTKETALAALKDTGYEIVDYCYTAGSLDLPQRGWRAELMRLPRRLLFSLNQDYAARVLGGFSLLVLAR